MRESDIVHENGDYWVKRERDAYTVYRVGLTHSTSDSSYAKTPEGLSVAISRCDYLARRVTGSAEAKPTNYQVSIRRADGEAERFNVTAGSTQEAGKKAVDQYTKEWKAKWRKDFKVSERQRHEANEVPRLVEIADTKTYRVIDTFNCHKK